MAEGLKVSLGELLEARAREFGPDPFVTQAETGETLTYAEFNGLVNRLANGLEKCGVRPNDYFGIMLSNSITFLAASYGLKKLGAIEVAINSTFRGVSLARMINVTGAQTLLTSSAYLAAIEDVAGQLKHLRRIILVDDEARPEARWETTALSDVMSNNDRFAATSVADTDSAVILFTSGTTGVSKGCAVPHRSSVRAAESMIEAFDLTAEDCVYSPYPLFHIGAAQYDVLPALMVGGRAVIRDSFSVKNFWPEVATYGATWFMALGSVQQLLWAAPTHPQENRHQLRFMWGTPLPVDADDFEARFKVKVARGGGYGSTEAGSVALPLFDKEGAGKILARYDVAILDDDGNPTAPNVTGELVIRANEPAIMAASYVGMPEETAHAWRNGWFHTGDLAYLDDDGDLIFVARASERMRVKGEMVSAYEIEEVLFTHPAIEDAAVIGVPEGTGEEMVKAFITVRKDNSIDLRSLQEFCEPRMSRFMIPTELEVLDAMPRTPTGKPAKSQLRAGQRP